METLIEMVLLAFMARLVRKVPQLLQSRIQTLCIVGGSAWVGGRLYGAAAAAGGG